MSEFHRFLKNDSSSDSEEGELSETSDQFQTKQEIVESNEIKIDSNALKTSKSLQIVDKIDSKRSNRFSIWSDLLLEEDLNHSVTNSMDIKKRRTKTRKLDRNCENYSFWTKKQLETNSDNNLSQNPINKRKKKNKKKRNDKNFNKPIPQTVDIVLEMAKKLNEPKVDLMRKVCQTIGEEKTSELLSATLDIESAGGLMTVDGKRRRTPGGVFFQLLKNDSNIPKESIELIFRDQQKNFKPKKKTKRKELKKTIENKTTNELNANQSTQIVLTDNQCMD